MRTFLLSLTWLSLLGAAVVPAQIPDGALVITNLTDLANPSQNGPGSLHLVDPATGAFATLNASLTTIGANRYGPSWVEMAADNTDLIVSYRAISPSNERLMHRIGPSGAILSTLIRDIGQAGAIRSFALDFDDTWILAGGRKLKSNVWTYNNRTQVFSTLFDATNPAGLVNSIVIDRGPGKPTYVLGKNNSLGSIVLAAADRSGIVATIALAPEQINSVDIDRTQGDYIVGSGGVGHEYGRVNVLGAFTTLNRATSLYTVSCAIVNPEHTCWLLSYDLQTQPVPPNPSDYVPAVYKFDLQGTLITFHRIPGYKQSTFTTTALTAYGSRRVVASGTGRPGTAVQIRFQSRKPTDAGRVYQLACAFAYTGGLKMPNGEYLDLSVDSLFLVTATNALPFLFQGFSGVLDKAGNATATVQIPAFLPPNLGITIFVSGIVIDPRVPGGVSTVGNTHWFVLS